MATTQSRVSSAKQSVRSGKMTDSRRERLLEIQKREQLKGMLVNKFKLKYGNKPNISRYIDNEVQRFLANDRLNESNLNALDTKIGREADLREKKDAILDDRRSERAYSAVSRQSGRSKLSAANLNALDNRSQAGSQGPNSIRSIRSRSSYAAKRPGPGSVTSSRRPPPTEAYSEINENDEWAAIQKFNTLLHFEEQKQAMLRDMERKRLIREQLAQQIEDKNNKNANMEDEDRMYHRMAEQHNRLLEDREKQRQKQVMEKIMNDKHSRDLQLAEERRRKKNTDKQQLMQEQEQIARLRDEMEQERQMQMEKRRQEREYLQKMLDENEKQKSMMRQQEEKERIDDLRAQEQYAKMQDKMEQDRVREMKSREARAQEFMNKMADNVLKKMEARQNFEDNMISRYEQEREMRQRQLEEARQQKMKNDQARMRVFLSQQVEEKKKRENDEKSNIDQQAQIWNVDKQNWDAEESRLKNRITQINRDNQNYLLKQMAEKQAKQAKMTYNEFQFNKQLLREINQKLKTNSSLASQSQAPSQAPAGINDEEGE